MLSSGANISGLSAGFYVPAAGFEGPLASLLAEQGNNTIKQVMTAAKLRLAAWAHILPDWGGCKATGKEHSTFV